MHILPTLLFAAVPLQEAGPTSEPLLREGAHIRIHSHLQNEAAADRALLVAEEAWRVAAEIYGFGFMPEGAGEGLRYEMHLYPDAASYEAVDLALTGGNFARNMAFAHFDSLSAHVALQPVVSPGALKVLGLPRQTLRLIAHEVSHLYRYAHFPNFRSHPSWLADGVASLIELKVLKNLELLADWAEDPYVSSSILNAQAVLEKDGLPSVSQILHDETDKLPFYQRYDIRWMLVEFLMEKEPELLQDILQTTRRLGGSPNFAKDLVDAFPQRLSASKLRSLDKAFRKYMGAIEPAWFEVYRHLYPFEGKLAHASFDSNAIAWRLKDSGKNYRIAGELTILEGTRTQLNLFLGRNEEGFHSVAFSAGYGVTLFAFRSKTNQWVRLKTIKVEALQLGVAMPFAVDVRGEKITIQLQNETVLEVETKEMPLTGPFALSAQAGSTGIWDIEEAPGW